MTYARVLSLPDLLAKKSFFLFGPRATGKSFLIREQLAKRATVVDLLRSDLLLRLSARPEELEAIVGRARGPDAWVVIDEVQKLPGLLDVVHRLIEERKIRFLPHRQQRSEAAAWAGQPAGRTRLERGDVPARLGRDPGLRAGETSALGWAPQRRVERRPARGAGGVQSHVPAGGDPRGGHRAPASAVLAVPRGGGAVERPDAEPRADRQRCRRAGIDLFDTGVTHLFAGTQTLDRNSDLWGRSFEHWIGLELRAWLSYRRRRETLAWWRSTHGHEVDFLVGRTLAIGVKATRRVSPRDLHGLRALAEEQVFPTLLLVSDDPVEAVRDGVRCVPWQTFVAELWRDRLPP